MSRLLILALLLVFVVRIFSSMLRRRRMRARVQTTVPVQRTGSPAESTGDAEPAPTVSAAPSQDSFPEVGPPIWEPVDDTEQQPRVAPLVQPDVPDLEPVPALEPDLDVVAEAPSGQPDLQLSPELEANVRAMMESGFEAGAVRLLCDELDVGIIEAQRAARGLAGLPTP
jgi:hypothetical protein